MSGFSTRELVKSFAMCTRYEYCLIHRFRTPHIPACQHMTLVNSQHFVLSYSGGLGHRIKSLLTCQHIMCLTFSLAYCPIPGVRTPDNNIFTVVQAYHACASAASLIKYGEKRTTTPVLLRTQNVQSVPECHARENTILSVAELSGQDRNKTDDKKCHVIMYFYNSTLIQVM